MKKWYGSYDLDGSFEIQYSEYEDFQPVAHMVGPCDTLAAIKKEIIDSFRHCIMELRMGIDDVKKTKKKEIIT